jgi:hypothetical protein
MAKQPLPTREFSITSSGDAFLVSVPVIEMVMERVITEIGITRGKAIYKKAIMAGGRVGLRAVKAEVQKISGKFDKKMIEGLEYGRSGALWRSMKTMFRTAKSGLYSYAVVGADRDFEVPARRGKHTIYEVPAATVHLVNNGFRAVHRIPGMVGRKNHNLTVDSLRRMATALKMEKAHKMSMAKLIGAGVDKRFTQFSSDKGFARQSAYLSKYKAAGTTEVAGRKFLQKAAAFAQGPSVAKVMEVMQAEFTKALAEMSANQ